MSLKRFDYLTRSQIQRIHNLKGDRNANRFLNDMGEYLSSFRHGLEKVYYLNKSGRDRVNCEVIRKKTPQIQHYILRNQAWIHLGRPFDWENEVKIIVGDTSIICDAKYTAKGKIPVFVEIDVSQAMAVNQRKIEKYRKFKELTGQKFFLIWITELDSRRVKLKELSEGLSAIVHSAKEIQ